MSYNHIFIKFSPMFIWNVVGNAKVVINNELVKEVKKETSIEVIEDNNHIVLKFEHKDFQTESVHLKVKNDEKIVLECGVKYNNVRLAFKAIIFMALVFFYYFIIRINNRVITNEDYKLYFLCSFIAFVFFCLDSYFNYLISRNPHKFVYFKRQINN